MINPMTDAPWLRIRPSLETCSGLRVGKEARCRLFVDALRWMARMGARCRPRTRSGIQSIAAGPTGATKASGRACWPTYRPIRTCLPYA